MMDGSFNCTTAVMQWRVSVEAHLEHHIKCLFRCLCYRTTNVWCYKDISTVKGYLLILAEFNKRRETCVLSLVQQFTFVADALDNLRFLPLQRVKMCLQRLQKTFWGLWNKTDTTPMKRGTGEIQKYNIEPQVQWCLAVKLLRQCFFSRLQH